MLRMYFPFHGRGSMRSLLCAASMMDLSALHSPRQALKRHRHYAQCRAVLLASMRQTGLTSHLARAAGAEFWAVPGHDQVAEDHVAGLSRGGTARCA